MKKFGKNTGLTSVIVISTGLIELLDCNPICSLIPCKKAAPVAND